MSDLSAVRNVRAKRAFYLIQEPQRGLYARLKAPAPSSPQPAEDSNDSVSARPSHVEFGSWELATWFRSHDEAERAFARYFAVAPLEIVRREP